MDKRNSEQKHTGGAAWYEHPAIGKSLHIGGIVMKVLTILLLILAITGIISGVALLIYLSTSFNPEKDLPNLDHIDAESTSVIYVKNEADEWEEFMALDGASHEYVRINEIPLDLQNAVVAIEDERFYDHYGVDWKRTISAVANEIFHFRSTFGGSTLTQQLIKNLTGEKDKTVSRKVTEIFGATYMEQKYEKEEILEAYLNVMPLTGDIVGVAYGAKYYFGKEVSELTLAECAVMATITNNPSIYDPYNHPENVRDRQHLVLQKMLECGFISVDEYKQAINEEVVFKSAVTHGNIQDYYTDMVVESVIADLVDSGYSDREAELLLYYGGLHIYSYEDPDLQSRIEAVFADESIYPPHVEGDEEDPSFAFIAIDYDGKVLATVGNRGEKEGSRVGNMATMAIRQCGSSIKPIAVYAPAIELNLTYYSEMIKDEPTTSYGGRAWPPNYNGMRFDPLGDKSYLVSVNQALRQSLNTIPVKLLNRVSMNYSHDFLTEVLGISTYVAEDRNASALALGGATYGTYLSELTAAYQIFGNGGLYNGYRCYEKVLDSEGNVLLSSAPANVQALSEDTAFVMNRLMTETVYNTEGITPGTLRVIRNDWKKIEMFAKTGTTDSNNDVLAIGGTPYCVGGAWFGYRLNGEMNYEQAQAVKDLYNLAMLEVHKGKDPATFTAPAGVLKDEYCKQTGLRATDKCKDKATGYYRSSNIPDFCNKCGKDEAPTPPTTGTTTGTGTESTGTTSGTGTTTGGNLTTPTGGDTANAVADLPRRAYQ